MRRISASRCYVVAAILSPILPAISPAQQIAIGEYAVTTPTAGPYGIASGPDGALWFTELDANRIGRIALTGKISEYIVPTVNGGPYGITAGPDGAMWFTESSANQIGRITTVGVVTEYRLPTANSYPSGISSGPDGALWFAESEANKIGRITTAGIVTEYQVLAAGSWPFGIAAGPDGALWFTEYYGNRIGRITTLGAITEYAVPTANSYPDGITAGPDGALWFTESFTLGNIGRITTGGTITEFASSGGFDTPWQIAAGPDGALWFTEEGGGSLSRITTAGIVTEYPIPARGTETWGIAAGPESTLWFTCWGGDYVGEAVFETADLSVTPASGYYRTSLTFTGSGFGANENVDIYIGGVGSKVLASATADASGGFTVVAPAPESPYGPRIFLATGQASGKLGAANFSVTPRLIMIPNSGPVGTSTEASGYGYGPLETVDIYWNNPRLFLGLTTTDVNGTFTGVAAFRFTVPPGAPEGVDTVSGAGVTSNAHGGGTFTVQ